jgi:hypothetical protein
MANGSPLQKPSFGTTSSNIEGKRFFHSPPIQEQ